MGIENMRIEVIGLFLFFLFLLCFISEFVLFMKGRGNEKRR